jgi:hypothetical protein
MQDLATALPCCSDHSMMGMEYRRIMDVYSTIAKNPTCGIGTEETGAAIL